jgi:hypothetical protein
MRVHRVPFKVRRLMVAVALLSMGESPSGLRPAIMGRTALPARGPSAGGA